MPAKKPTSKVPPRNFYAESADADYRALRERVKAQAPVVLGLLLQQRSKSQADLARHMGLSHSAVRHRVYGRTEFTVSELVAIAHWLDVDVAVFTDPNAPIHSIIQAKSTPSAPASASEPAPEVEAPAAAPPATTRSRRPRTARTARP